MLGALFFRYLGNKKFSRCQVTRRGPSSRFELEKLCQERSRRSEELQGQLGQAEARLESLRKEKGRVSGSIGTIRDGGLKELEQTGDLARQHLDGLLVKLMEYGELQQAADTLKDDLALARAFKNLDPEEWGKGSRFGIQRLIWAQFH